MKSPSEEQQVLLPRLVMGAPGAKVHICLADSRFAHGAIVTLEALCGEWQYGTLSRTSIHYWLSKVQESSLCMNCWYRWRHR